MFEGAQSTKAGFKKDHHYMIQISNMPLHQEAYILQEMLEVHPVVIRCIGDCVPHPLIMPLPKSQSQRNPLDVGKTPSTYHLLVLESNLSAQYLWTTQKNILISWAFHVIGVSSTLESLTPGCRSSSLHAKEVS